MEGPSFLPHGFRKLAPNHEMAVVLAEPHPYRTKALLMEVIEAFLFREEHEENKSTESGAGKAA